MKQQRQLIALLVLLVIAATVWYFLYFRGQSAPGATNVATARKYELLGIDNPSLHWPEMKAASGTEYKSNGRNPFSKEAPPPPDQPAPGAQWHLAPCLLQRWR
jgi:hypothetical protein